jgi:sterol desaturase/sphingolipid hydroxylase (fatty acid hydroxylase superfamily)
MSSSSNNTILKGSLVQRLAATIPTLSTKKNANKATQELFSQLITNLSTPQSLQDLLILTILVVIALEILNQLVYHVPSILHTALTATSTTDNDSKKKKKKAIPVRGKHLDNFTIKDYTFIMINKCMTGLFVYCYFGYLWSVRKLEEDNSDTGAAATHHHNCCNKNNNGGQGIFTNLTFQNTLLPLPLLFLTYDFFYTLLHWGLHMKSIYAYIHKHHHYQKAPSRANIDAVNVHPVEFFLGEFNHILALRIVLKGIKISVPGNATTTTMALLGYKGMDVSWLCAVLFIGLGGILAGLNHTRHDVVLSVPSTTTTTTTSASTNNNNTTTTTTNNNTDKGYLTIFDSKHHDVHHRIPQSNYGQYTVFWDRIFGTFRDYDENDRVNPAYQLDPLTGKTLVANNRKKED